MAKYKAGKAGAVRMFERATEDGRLAINALYITKIEMQPRSPQIDTWRLIISLAGAADVVVLMTKEEANAEFDFWIDKAENAK